MDASTVRRRRRKAPPEVRREQLIDAAMEVIAESGISGATAANITKRAGLSLGIVSLHFDGMKDLFSETLRQMAIEKRDLWADAYSDGGAAPAVRLAAIVDAMFDPRVCSPTKIAVWFAFFGEARYRTIYRDFIDEFDNEREDALTELCAMIKREGAYGAVDPEALAVSIESLTDGLWLSLMLYPDWMKPNEARDQVVAMIAAHFPNHFRPPAAACDKS